MRYRRTIASVVRAHGKGLHTGEKSSVSIWPSEKPEGVLFRFGDATYNVSEARTLDSRRNTTIVFPGGEKLSTVEHLMSALAGLDVDDAVIEVTGSELPALDGSALEYAAGFMSVGFAKKDECYLQPFISTPVCIDFGPASITALPSDILKVTYVIDYPGTVLGTEMKDVVIEPETFFSEIAPARTFALLSEVEALRASGLAAGGNLENTVVIDRDRLLNEDGYRIERECAAHKVLDLLGDLALSGSVPRARYICIRGGHRLHSILRARISAAGICSGAEPFHSKF